MHRLPSDAICIAVHGTYTAGAISPRINVAPSALCRNPTFVLSRLGARCCEFGSGAFLEWCVPSQLAYSIRGASLGPAALSMLSQL
eukprot:6340850-Alexandrium_andersonii.AAC.1